MALLGAEEEYEYDELDPSYKLAKGAENLLKLKISNVNLGNDVTVEVIQSLVASDTKRITSLDLSWTCLKPK